MTKAYKKRETAERKKETGQVVVYVNGFFIAVFTSQSAIVFDAIGDVKGSIRISKIIDNE